MNVSAEERSLRRRLVFNAMPKTASIEVVQQCIDILENEFGNEPEIKYSQVMKRFGEAVEDKINFSPILGRIVFMSRKPIDEIGPDPGKLGIGKAAITDPKEIVFNQMFGSIFEQVSKRGSSLQSDFCRQLKEQCFALPLDGDCKRTVSEWSATEGSAQITGSVEDLQKVINESFVWMCSKFGPVEADKVLHRAIHSASQLPQAYEFSPKNLL